MRPISHTQNPAFLERFSNIKDAVLESLAIVSPTEIELTFSLQDKARAFDWIKITFSFSGVSDAHLPKENHLAFVDMSQGASLLFSENSFAFGTSECYNISSVKNSSLYLIAKSLKYEENPF